MENSQINFQSLISNPGFEHLGHNILRHLNKKTVFSLRMVNNDCKNFVENPRFWLKKLNFKNCESTEIHEAWLTLIQKVEEENYDLKENLALNFIKLFNYDDNFSTVLTEASKKILIQELYAKQLFPLNLLSLFGDLPLVKFIIKNKMDKCLSKICKGPGTWSNWEFGEKLRHKWLRGTPKNGWAPIHQAAHRGHTEIVKALAECIDNPNPQENGICTAIHLAEEIGQTESVQALINCTNNLDLVSKCCKTCLKQKILKQCHSLSLLKPLRSPSRVSF